MWSGQLQLNSVRVLQHHHIELEVGPEVHDLAVFDLPVIAMSSGVLEVHPAPDAHRQVIEADPIRIESIVGPRPGCIRPLPQREH